VGLSGIGGDMATAPDNVTTFVDRLGNNKGFDGDIGPDFGGEEPSFEDFRSLRPQDQKLVIALIRAISMRS
jgi:hypothetical protein